MHKYLPPETLHANHVSAPQLHKHIDNRHADYTIPDEPELLNLIAKQLATRQKERGTTMNMLIDMWCDNMLVDWKGGQRPDMDGSSAEETTSRSTKSTRTPCCR